MDYEKQLKQLIDSFAVWWDDFPTPTMTSELYPYTSIFSPIKINRMTVKNRLVMAPMGNISMCEETGRPNDKMLSYFEERAKGGVGLLTTGLIPISLGIDNSLLELGDLTYFPRIDRSRTVYMGWRNLAAKVHAHGSKIFVQLTPGLGRVGNPQCLVNSFKFPQSASLNPNFYMTDVPCLPMSDAKCTKIIKRAGQAAADAKGFNLDGVYLHGHEGYFLEQMTNTAYNRRVLGKYSDWQRFGIDMVKEIRRRAGDCFPIMYRIDLSLALNATYGEKMDTEKGLKKFKNERKISETLEYMSNLVKAGVDMFDVDLGSYDNWWLPHPPASMPSGCYLSISKIAKDYFKENNILSNAGVEVPIVAVGKLGYPDLAEKALRDNMCDMVMLGRPLLSDPDWANKAFAGKVKDIRPCIGCQEGCINEFVEGGHPQCAVNPRTAFENEYSAEIPKATTKKKVAIVGAGPAGVTAAEVLLERGHSVDLYEKESGIGGAIRFGSVGKIKYEIRNYLDFLTDTVEKLKQNPDFKLLLKTEASSASLKKEGYDVIVVASGGTQVKPRVEGIDNENVIFAIDALKNPDLVKDANDIVIIGGGVVGCEVAYWLRYELNKKNITVVEMLEHFMLRSCTANRGHLIHYLEQGGVKLYNCTKLIKVENGEVVLEKNTHKRVPDAYNTWNPVLPENIENPMDKIFPIKYKPVEVKLKADKILLSVGVRPNDDFYFKCVKDLAAPEIYNIGDSLKPARVYEAVRAAYRKARSI